MKVSTHHAGSGWRTGERRRRLLKITDEGTRSQSEGLPMDLDALAREGLSQLTLHADRGSSMRSKTVAILLADVGVTKTHSRPYTSTDNPYSEAHFKTLKYRPDFPGRFGSIEHGRAFCGDFFPRYGTTPSIDTAGSGC